jgi:hypothetical protein
MELPMQYVSLRPCAPEADARRPVHGAEHSRSHAAGSLESRSGGAATASHWLIVGYSLPAEDIAIRSMLMRAYQARADRPRITVVVKEDQPEPARALKNRYRLLFPECDYFTDGLEAFIDSHQLI